MNMRGKQRLVQNYALRNRILKTHESQKSQERDQDASGALELALLSSHDNVSSRSGHSSICDKFADTSQHNGINNNDMPFAKSMVITNRNQCLDDY